MRTFYKLDFDADMDEEVLRYILPISLFSVNAPLIILYLRLTS